MLDFILQCPVVSLSLVWTVPLFLRFKVVNVVIIIIEDCNYQALLDEQAFTQEENDQTDPLIDQITKTPLLQ